MIWVERKTYYKSMEQNRDPGNTATHMCPSGFEKGSKAIQWRKKNSFSSSGGTGTIGHK